MEGVILELETLVSPWNVIAGTCLLAIVAGMVLFGYMAEEEKTGRRLFWAEWPIPESEVPSHEEELRIAA
jgi:hypothetical protein